MRTWIRDRTPRTAPAASKAELREAYQRGRRDERARRRRSTLIMLSLSVAALAGAGMLAVSVWQGSFSGGGAVVDQQIAYAADTAQPKLRAAAGDARKVLVRAGDEAKSKTRNLIGG